MVVPSNAERQKILQLIDEKEKIEQEIYQLGEVLHANKIGMHESLTVDGFPRNDIDVYQVRNARHKIICLQNDLKALTNSIEKGLESIHACNKQGLNSKQSQKDFPVEATFTKAIVRINNITMGSPGYEAGLKVLDEIVEFGSLNESNFESINQISDLMYHSQNKPVRIKLIRDGHAKETIFIPKPWAGNGLLGCNITPL